MRSLTISLILTGLSFSKIKANKILDDESLAMQEELFLSKLLSTMNVTNYKVSPKHSLSNLRNFLKMFDIIPYISTRGEKSLFVDLSPHDSQILRRSSVLLWLPLSWLTQTTHFKRRKNFLLKSSNIVGERDGWLGLNVTRLAKRCIRRGRAYLEIEDLSREFYIQTAFLEITTGPADKEDDESEGRTKRSEDGTCSLQELSVNLTQIGWHFVISPSLLQFRYCSGACSVRDIPARMFIKQHGQIRYKLHKRGTFSLPPACCSPSEYEGIVMVYLDGHDDNGRAIIRRGEFQNALASSCGCG